MRKDPVSCAGCNREMTQKSLLRPGHPHVQQVGSGRGRRIMHLLVGGDGVGHSLGWRPRWSHDDAQYYCGFYPNANACGVMLTCDHKAHLRFKRRYLAFRCRKLPLQSSKASCPQNKASRLESRQPNSPNG